MGIAMMKKTMLRLSQASMVLVGMTIACAPGAWAQSEKPVVFGHSDAWAGLDIYPYSSQINHQLASHIWDQLVDADPATGDIKPQIAESWRRIDDKTLEFKIRRGITFHNGEALTADDVEFTINTFTRPDIRVQDVALIDWIANAKKIDDYTVQIISKAAFPPALEYLSKALYIYPKDYYTQVGAQGMNEKPVGSGAYKFVSAEKGKVVQLEAFENYIGASRAKPTIRRIDFRLIPDQQTLLAELIAGGVDLAVIQMPPDQTDRVKTVPNLTVKEIATSRMLFIQFNLTNEAPFKPLLDVRVRQAIAQAIDRKTIATSLLGKSAEVLNAVCVPTQFGCKADKNVVGFDPNNAKKLLADAGYPNGLDIEFFAHRERPIAEAIIGYLRNVGIRAKLNYLQLPALRDLKYANKVPLHFLSWGSYGIYDVSAIIPVYFGGTREDFVKDKSVVDLIATAGTTIDAARRERDYSAANAIINEKVLGIPLWSVQTNFIGSSRLKFNAYRDERPRFWETSVQR